MATKVFISWSGELSRKLGDALHNWLPSSLQYVRPYFSPEDIEKGTKWGTEIAKELESANVGVICLTQENTEKPWILFEAGALSKSLDKSRVCTLLFGIEPTDVKGPLTMFQSTRFVRDDFKRLVLTINNTAGDAKLDGSVLDSVFEMWWPRLESKVHETIRSHDKGSKKEKRSERDILEEVLELARIGASRNERGPRISERALREVLDVLEEMMFVAEQNGDEMPYHFMRRLDRPFSYLCKHAGIPETYMRQRMRVREAGRPRPESDSGTGSGESNK